METQKDRRKHMRDEKFTNSRRETTRTENNMLYNSSHPHFHIPESHKISNGTTACLMSSCKLHDRYSKQEQSSSYIFYK